MKREQFFDWLERIYSTRDMEIDCERLQAFLPAYVEAEIGGGDLAGESLLPVRAHLAQCPDCAEEYQGLHAVASLEASGCLPQADEILSQFEFVTTSEATEPVPN